MGKEEERLRRRKRLGEHGYYHANTQKRLRHLIHEMVPSDKLGPSQPAKKGTKKLNGERNHENKRRERGTM